MTPPDKDAPMWPLLHQAARTPAIDHALKGLYDNLDQHVQQRGPTCWLSGRCCHFDAYDHRLYVTALEIAWVLAQPSSPGPDHSDTPSPLPIAGTPSPPEHETGCPFQINQLCSIHAIRPMGCRVFFCQEGTGQWQNQLYESFLNQLRRLHEQHTLPYRYMEWRAGLREASSYTDDD